MSGPVTHHSFCRACVNACPTLVDVEDGRLVRVTGDPDNEVFDGYSCVKGRMQPELHHHEDRLLRPLRREADGTFTEISIDLAMDEVAERLGRIIEEHGPRSFACYVGTAAAQNNLNDPFFTALLAAVGSRMKFSPNTIDKPGKSLALAMHGTWMAPLQGYHDPQVALVLGANPYKSYYGAAAGHPAKWLQERLASGMKLIVVDPRRSDIAKRAHLHLQPRPGHDPAILACLINVILAEGLGDQAFVAENASGVPELRDAVAPFTPTAVAEAAGLDPDDLITCARMFAAPTRGYAVCGVGPGFSKSSTLVEYLVLVLETLCGHWMRAGERVLRTTTLLPSGPWVAQPASPRPAYGLGEPLRVRGLTQTTAGMPTAALPEEILLEGEGQVRALFSVGGNPVVSWPDQLRAVEALRSLELFVQFDPWMSPSARLADFVIPTTMPYETPAATLLTDYIISMPTYYGPAEAYGQYSDAVIAPPSADVIPEWQFAHGVAQRLGLELSIKGKSVTPDGAGDAIHIQMSSTPRAEDLIAALAANGRVSLDEVKQHPSGATFLEPAQYVEPRQPGWEARFDLANTDMLSDLEAETPGRSSGEGDRQYPFRLVNIRVQHVMNSSASAVGAKGRRTDNPAYLHPEDLAVLGLSPGDEVDLVSARAAVPAIVEIDASLRRCVVAITFGYGDAPGRDGEFRSIGTSPGRLLDGDAIADPYVGMPRMGNVAIDVRRRLVAPVTAGDER